MLGGVYPAQGLSMTSLVLQDYDSLSCAKSATVKKVVSRFRHRMKPDCYRIHEIFRLAMAYSLRAFRTDK